VGAWAWGSGWGGGKGEGERREGLDHFMPNVGLERVRMPIEKESMEALRIWGGLWGWESLGLEMWDEDLSLWKLEVLDWFKLMEPSI
jgi:hypothetical protein